MEIQTLIGWFRYRNEADLKANELAEVLTEPKLTKLLYLAQGVTLPAFDQPLFKESILAWKHGPGIPEIHQQFGNDREAVTIGDDADHLAYRRVEADDVAGTVLNAVYDTYGDMSASDLVKLTTAQVPWIKAEPNEIIDLAVMQHYFSDKVLKHA